LYYLYNNTSRNIPQDIFGKFDKKNKPIKAFGGFLFFISVKQPDDHINVVVKTDGLMQKDIAQITDVVTKTTGVSVDKITIIERK
jgi:hypothetical protein